MKTEKQVWYWEMLKKDLKLLLKDQEQNTLKSHTKQREVLIYG